LLNNIVALHGTKFCFAVPIFIFKYFQDKKKRTASKTPSKPSAGKSTAEAAYFDMMKEKKRLNRLKARAAIAESYEAAMFWRFRREALKAAYLAKGVTVPDVSDIDTSDSPFHSGALARFMSTEESDSDRIVKITFLHFYNFKFFIHLKIRKNGWV
jgi:hypothetical protein